MQRKGWISLKYVNLRLDFQVRFLTNHIGEISDLRENLDEVLPTTPPWFVEISLKCDMCLSVYMLTYGAEVES